MLQSKMCCNSPQIAINEHIHKVFENFMWSNEGNTHGNLQMIDDLFINFRFYSLTRKWLNAKERLGLYSKKDYVSRIETLTVFPNSTLLNFIF